MAKLAERCRLSASHLSQIEQGKKMPSLITLAGIAEVLEINPGDLLETTENRVHVTRAGDKPDENSLGLALVSTKLTSAPGDSDLGVQRLLLHSQSSVLEIGPRPGEIFGFVLAGTLLIAIDDEQIELEAWDSIHYDGQHSYRLWCRSKNPCEIVWCTSPPRQD